MKRINKENNFLIIWLTCVLVLFVGCNLGFFKGTWSAFGDMTGQLTVPYTMNYVSNYPDELGLVDEETIINVKGETYTIMDNVFKISGYEFVGWNTLRDGTGDVYNSGDNIPLDKSLTFYAQWKKVEIIQKLLYGDVNHDGLIDNNDYLLIEQYVSLGTRVDDQGLSNADVNVDGKIDIVDVDIIKQVCLGTEGYVGILPNNPILIYDVYKGTINDDENNEDSNLPSDDEQQSGNQSQNGNSSSSEDGSSSSNSSSSSDSSNNSGGGTGGQQGSSSGNKPASDNASNDSGNVQGNLPSNDGQNDDILNNVGDQYNEVTNKDEIIIRRKPNDIYVLIMVLCICLLTIRCIVYIVSKFKQNEKNI